MRVAIFTSACCTGWCYSYEADDATQSMIKQHADKFNNVKEWQNRNCDGGVTIYDSVEAAIETHNEDHGGSDEEDRIETESDLHEFYMGDGDGRTVNAAWIVHMLLTDATIPEWTPPV